MIGATSLANVTPAIFSAPRLKRNAKKNASASAAAIRINLKAPFITTLQEKGEKSGSVPRAVASEASQAGLLIETRSLPLAVLIINTVCNAVRSQILQKPFGRRVGPRFKCDAAINLRVSHAGNARHIGRPFEELRRGHRVGLVVHSGLDDLLNDAFVEKTLATFTHIERQKRRHPVVVQIENIAHADPVILKPTDEEDVWRNLR